MHDIKAEPQNTEITFEAGDIKIVLAPLMTSTEKPARKHRKRRIQKKWLKRYGYKAEPDTGLYFVKGDIVMMHPQMYEELEEALGEKTLLDTLKSMNKEKKKEQQEDGNV